jgi:glycosyltransferase involved in cell wall biosynthesis
MIDLTYIIAVKGPCPELWQLIDSIQHQSNSSLMTEILIIDGGCPNIPNVAARIIQSDDFGIYHALNNGIKHAQGTYYVVAGQDDSFSPDFELNIEFWIKIGDYELINGAVAMDNVIVSPFGRNIFGYDAFKGLVACHSVGMVIKRSLHCKYGYYSNHYPICADRYFVSKVRNHINAKITDKVFGKYGTSGTSAQFRLQSQCEQFLIAVESVSFARSILFVFLLSFKLIRFFCKKCL